MCDTNKILKVNDITIDNIVLKKQICIGNNLYNIPIKYLVNNLIIQTPIIFIPFTINKYKGNNYLDISFLNSEIDKEMSLFKKFIIDFNKYIETIINKKNKNLEFVNSIKKSNSIFPDRLRLSIDDNILVFNDKKQLINFDMIQPKIYSKLLISPLCIWKNNKQFGIKWYILQTKIYPKLILDCYSFIDDDEDTNKNKETTINYKNHPKYSKYFKMVSCGVPKDAVKHKMLIDNLDPNILDGNINNKSTIINDCQNNLKDVLNKNMCNLNRPKINLSELINKNKELTKNKSESLHDIKNNNNSMLMFRPTMSDILNQKDKLKKNTIESLNKNKNTNIKYFINNDTSPGRPSMSDILNQKDKLKKLKN